MNVKITSKGLFGAVLWVSSTGVWAACSDITFEQLSAAAFNVKNLPAEQALTGGLKNNIWVTEMDPRIWTVG